MDLWQSVGVDGVSDFVEKITNKKDIKTEIERDITVFLSEGVLCTNANGCLFEMEYSRNPELFFLWAVKLVKASKKAVPNNVPKIIFKKESQKRLDRSKKLTYVKQSKSKLNIPRQWTVSDLQNLYTRPTEVMPAWEGKTLRGSRNLAYWLKTRPSKLWSRRSCHQDDWLCSNCTTRDPYLFPLSILIMCLSPNM